MKIAILGAGKQANGALSYLSKQRPTCTIGLVDINEDLTGHLRGRYPDLNIICDTLDAKDEKECGDYLKDFDVAFNALPYKFALGITRAAIHGQCHLVDLGGNNDIVDAQFELHEQAKAAGITIVPDCGLAPGLVSILVADAVENSSMSDIESVKIYVGGLPLEKDKSGPLSYGDFFSFEGLINEYTQPVKAIRDGKLVTLEPLTELEGIYFDTDRFEDLEAFTTSGGASTLPETFLGQVKNLEYKTLRFPGHLAKLQLLQSMGGLTVEIFKKLCPSVKDQVFVRIDVVGETANGDKVSRKYTMHDHPPAWDYEAAGFEVISSMQRCTAYPAAAIMTMLASGKLSKGVQRQENIINPSKLIPQLRKVGLRINLKETIEYAW